MRILAAACVAFAALAQAQPMQRPPRVALVGTCQGADCSSPSSVASTSTWAKAFVSSLGQLGWVDGKSAELLWRTAPRERIPEVVGEIVSAPVDVIVADVSYSALEAMKRTQRIPIVVRNAFYPVSAGLAGSLARPGTNVTGVANNPGGIEINGKQLALLKEAAPRVSMVAYLTSPLVVNEDRYAEGGLDPSGIPNRTVAAGRAVGITMIRIEVDSHTPLDQAVGEALRRGANGLMVDTSREPRVLVAFAERHKLPAVYTYESGVEAGGLMHYGRSGAEHGRQVASIVDRILRGTKPAAIPFEAPSKMYFTVNLKAAKAIGLAIPPSVLTQADHVIE